MRRLDQSSARIITLVAPAGYGKTTLARQWLADTPHVWLHANDASSDPVGLAIALAETLAPLGNRTTDQLIARIGTLRDFRKELRSLAELQAEELGSWPDDTWLVIDDYEHIAQSAVAEEYVWLLLHSLGIRSLVATRVNPAWATPRAFLYGDIDGIYATELAMRNSETRAVLRGAPESRVAEILELADGWPALVGLASLTRLDDTSIQDLPRPLFDYFADELFHRCSRALQIELPRLALAPRLSSELAAFILGPRKGPRLLAEATSVGFLSANTADLRLHPLLRRFLLSKLNGDSATRRVVDRLVEYLLQRCEWDDAFELIRQERDAVTLLKMCDAGYASMVSSGRTTTLESWLGFAAQLGVASPLLDLIRSELALRNGNLARAERLALSIVSEERASRYRSRAFTVAGKSAHMDNRESAALAFFQSAAGSAQTDEERREATWGSLLSAQAMETEEEVRETLSEFLGLEPSGADDVIRAANARFMVALTIGNVAEVVEFGLGAVGALDHAHDPLIRTSFLNALSRLLSTQARYLEGQVFAERLIVETREAKLDFVLPYAYLAKAIALIGTQQFTEAERMVRQVEKLARQMGDLHNVLEARCALARLAVSLRNYDQALAVIHDACEVVSVTEAMSAEVLVTRGLAQACSGAVDEADESLCKGEALSALPEIRALTACVRAISKLRRGADAHEAALEVEPAFNLGILDPVVIVCRACPELFDALSLRHMFPAVSFRELPPTSTPGGSAGLTNREAEVLELLSLGYTNREVAKELFIEEVTAKVHVRNILRKLGVRSRTEAAIVALRESISLKASSPGD
jgi:LuxR family transcriptional regulator, maltose regulon positive regulatory protein